MGGGAQCALYKACGYECYSLSTGGSSGQFGFIRLSNSVSDMVYVNYSSISRCVKQVSNHYYTMYHDNGKIFYPSVNVSMNKCHYYSGIYCNPSTDSSSVTCSLSYSSFTDNNDLGYTCIRFCNGGAKCEIKSCNILRNTQSSTSYATIFTNGILNIDDSCILENTATTIFYSSSSSYPITLTNCTVDKTTNNGYLTIRNTVTKSFILGLNHLSTQNCHSKYDSIGNLTPISYVPNPTKKEYCYTSKNCFQGRTSIFFSIIWMLLFTFIHPNPFGGY
jgi:hypothetical protein